MYNKPILDYKRAEQTHLKSQIGNHHPSQRDKIIIELDCTLLYRTPK